MLVCAASTAQQAIAFDAGARDTPGTRFSGFWPMCLAFSNVPLPQYFARHGRQTAVFRRIIHDGAIAVRDRTNELLVSKPSLQTTS